MSEVEDFEDLFENAPCGYLSLDKDGRILRVNRTFSTWTGFAPDTVMGRRFPELLPISGKIFYETHFAPTLFMRGEVREVAMEIVRPDGAKLPVFLNATVRLADAERPARIRVTVFNASERRSYERHLLATRDSALQVAEAQQHDAELREQFIAVLGHDLRNPLASIASGVRLLQREPLSERAKLVTALMDGSVVRAAGLIDNVMDFARGRLGGGISLARDAREPLEPTLRQVVAELRSIAPDRIVVEEYRMSEPVSCDRGRVAQLLSNLLGNALTYGAKEAPVRVSAITDGSSLAISVANAGRPIPAEAMAGLFQPFFRGETGAAREGLGLGLHIASEIAKAHGGSLSVASDEIETRFTFAMPLE